MIGTGGAGGLINGTKHNQVSVAKPGLATTLANNGGLTPTIALLFGSPAIDAGSNALAVNAQGNPLPYDQRGPGYPRIVDSVVDIGAYEQAAATTTVITSSLNPSIVGETVTFTVKVSAKYASTIVPTGTVTFVSGTLVLGTVTLVNGSATLSTNALPVGADPVVATYSGDSNFANSVAPTFTQTVDAASTIVATIPAVIPAAATHVVTPASSAAITLAMPTVKARLSRRSSLPRKNCPMAGRLRNSTGPNTLPP